MIEITAGPSGELPADLLIAAYRASQWDRIALVLNGVLPADVDYILDPVVRTLPLDIPGLTYIDITQGPQVRDALLEAAAESHDRRGREGSRYWEEVSGRASSPHPGSAGLDLAALDAAL